MKQIQKMYRKEKSKHKEEKKYVVNRSVTSAMGNKMARGVKAVDSRMKKDNRNMKIKKKKGVKIAAPKQKGGQKLGKRRRK